VAKDRPGESELSSFRLASGRLVDIMLPACRPACGVERRALQAESVNHLNKVLGHRRDPQGLAGDLAPRPERKAMGKGDRRTRRGKLWRGTYGKRRPRKKKRVPQAPRPS